VFEMQDVIYKAASCKSDTLGGLPAFFIAFFIDI
jgi:hypothetical protein